MQTLTRPRPATGPGLTPPRRGKRFSPLALIGVIVTLIIAIGAGAFLFVQKHIGSHAAAANVNMDCTLIVPNNPLSAQGLATPWQLLATDQANGPCNMVNPNQTTFVQGAIFDPATGQISIYNPLVIDQGTQPAAPPVVPPLPANAIVALWGGSQATNITLQAANGNTLQTANCVNGTRGSVFGQFWYCNAPAFFQAAHQAIQQGKLVVPPLGTAKDGMSCPTTSDFSVVDMDPHDNVTTTYLVTKNGQTAQMTAANVAALQNAQPQANGSDERLVAVALDGALGCKPWMAPDLADKGNMVPALPLNELQAAQLQGQPQALVPSADEMVTVNNNPSLRKLNQYRAGVNEPLAPATSASTRTFCQNLLRIAPQRIMLDAQFTVNRPSPDAGAANNLATFLAQRFVATYGPNGLNCQPRTNKPDPIAVQTDNNGVAIAATINGVPLGGNGQGQGQQSAPTCNVNGATVAGCAGTTTINGQNCTFSFANDTVTINCGAGSNGAGAGNGGAQPQGQLDTGDGGKDKVTSNPTATLQEP